MLTLLLLPALLIQSESKAESFQTEAEALAERFVEAERVVGLSAGVVLPSGEVVELAVGTVSSLDERIPDSETLYEIGSVSKVLTGVLLAESVLREELTLETEVASLLPEGVSLDARRKRPIRLVHLTTHGSGLPRMPTNFDLEAVARSWNEYDAEALYECLSDHKARRTPGKRYAYSNLGVGLLGHLLELRTETPYETLLVQRICEPLEMNSTRVQLGEGLEPRFASGHDVSLEPAEAWDMAVLAPCGGVRSCVKDMLLFLQANLAGDSKLEPALKLAREVHSDFGEKGPRVGLGWHVAGDGHTRIHSGQTAGYEAYLAVSPGLRTGVVILSNTASMQLDKLGTLLFNLALGVHLDPPDWPAPLALGEEELQSYVGRYRTEGKVAFELELTRRGSKLFAQVVGPDQGICRVLPISKKRFEYVELDASLDFAFSEGGEVEGLVFRQMGIEHECSRVPDSE